MNCIIHKIEYINGSVIHSPIGYTDRTRFISNINSNYDNTLGSWIESNKADLESGVINISSFFELTPVVYVAKTVVTSVKSIKKITDL